MTVTQIITHRVMPDEGIEMQISLDGNGNGIIELHGRTIISCWCGGTHNYKVDAKLTADTSMEQVDMDDLEGALRGDELHARRFGWRLVNKFFFLEHPPCES